MASTAIELRLSPLELEAGGCIVQHVVRGVYASPQVEDVDSLRNAGVALADSTLLAAPTPIRRSGEQLQAIAAPTAPLLGRARAADQKTILIVHALTGDARAVCLGGYWAQLAEPHNELRLEQHRVVSLNLLGSCYGTSGPLDAGFPARKDQIVAAKDAGAVKALAVGAGIGAFELPDAHPAAVTTFDQARSILATLDALGIDQVDLAVGGSLGGMVVLALGTLAPQRFRTIMPIAATAAASAWLCAWNHLARAAIALNRERGFELARQIGMLSYRAEPGLAHAQPMHSANLLAPQPVQTWLEHHGSKLKARFDVDAYLCLLGAMDSHNLARAAQWGIHWRTALAQTQVLGVSIDTDQLYTPAQTEAYVQLLKQLGAKAESAQITSLFGHDAFLIEINQVAKLMQRALYS
jgi:homoserine O-acetyltransferase/O-succinyltransferase